MSRRIVTEKWNTSDTRPLDNWADKVTKSIPADVVAGWVGVTGLLAARPSNITLLWILFVVFVAITIAWTWRQTQEGDKPVAKVQIAISTFAFVFWAFAFGAPFNSLPFYQPELGAALLIVFSLITAVIPVKQR